MRKTQHNLIDIFGNNGLLAEALPGFAVRNEQLQMAESVTEAISSANHLIVEAGTGVGKTFAYLVPALLSGKRTLISTGTKSLQDQLFSRDLPAIAAAIGRPVHVALLKGRSNYLCLHRLQQSYEQATTRGFSRELARSVQLINNWSTHTRRGDVSELTAVAEDSMIWPYVTSTRDNCIGTECALFDRCWVMKARREAQAADIVVVNHHLLMADLMLKEGGFGELLPGAEVVIVDEAHQLPDVATQALGVNLSARQLREWINDVMRGRNKIGGIGDAELKLIDSLEQHLQSIVRLMPEHHESLAHTEWPDPILDALHDSMEVFKQFAESTSSTSAEQAELKSLRDRALELLQRLQLFAAPVQENGAVRWINGSRSGFVLHQALINVAKPLGDLIAKQGGAWIFTSATLSIANELRYFAESIGLLDARQECFGSPFNYQEQALLYLPADMDMPSSLQHTEQVITAALPVIQSSEGGVFMLFTSHRALKRAATLLRMQSKDDFPYPLLVQGESPRDQLLKQFRDEGNAVLLGTQSFWEGVDVKGRALCVVIIDKLPFAVPDEPLAQARQVAIERRGGNPFMEEQIPQAVVTLRQGVGRLIRDATDFGVIMICDRRLTTRSYGKLFLRSLPPMKTTSRVDDVQDFLRGHINALA